MNLPPSSTGMNDSSDRFPSLMALRVTHNQLLKQYREEGNVPEVLHKIDAFIRKGTRTGVLLDNENDRWACQGLLDYWSSMLYRAGYEPSNATLDAFDSNYAPTLEDTSCPYKDFAQFRTQIQNFISASELREAIEKPAELVGLKFEEGVVDALIQDTLYEPDSLSLLQFILLRLWEKRDRNKITWESYQQIGRGRQSLIQVADQLIDEFTPEEQEIAKQIMLNLAQFDKGPSLIKRRVTRSILYTLLGVSKEVPSDESNQSASKSSDLQQPPEQKRDTESSQVNVEPSVEFDEILQMLTSETSYRFESNLPNLKNRFHALLKRRLRAEVERKPPLFSWETVDYAYENESPISQFIAPSFWAAQLYNLNLPVPISENLLQNLFIRCQSLMRSSVQDGTRLVQAVEHLFPEQEQTLNNIAGMVMASPARSGRSAPARANPPGYPDHYNNANSSQKMALSLMAARELFNSFTFSVSPEKPAAERCWETTAGTLLIRTSFTNNQLLIEGQFPCKGKLLLYGGGVTAISQCNTNSQQNAPYHLSISIYESSPKTSYSLEIQLDELNHSSVVFAIHVGI